MNYMIPASYVKDLILKKVRSGSLELMVGYKCHNYCKYCYMRHLQNNAPVEPLSPARIRMYIENAFDMGLVKLPVPVEFFGGDSVISFDYLMMLARVVKDYATYIALPTNGRVLQHLTFKQIDELNEVSNNKIRYSLSVDSPYQDVNRPLSAFGKMLGFKSEVNYDYLFKLCEKYPDIFGWHPMLYFETADQWFNTFKFFIDRGASPYLLEVRHPLTKQQAIKAVIGIGKIVRYIIKHNLDINSYNCTRPSQVPRGLGCSALSSTTINPEGKVVFCHRLMSEPYVMGDVTTKEVAIRKLIGWRAMFNLKNSAICMNCPLNNSGLCAGQCMGAVAEYWGGRPVVGMPIPSLCKWYYPLKVEILQRLSGVWHAEFEKIDKDKFYNILYSSFTKSDIDRMMQEIEEVD